MPADDQAAKAESLEQSELRAQTRSELGRILLLASCSTFAHKPQWTRLQCARQNH